MATLPTDSYASLGIPLWLSNPVKELQLDGDPPVILTNNNGVFEVNGNPVQAVNTWSLYPTLSNQIILDASNNISLIGSDLYFNDEIIAVAGAISNVSDWYLYPALAKVDLNSGVGIDFNGRQLTRDGTILRFGGVSLDDSEWATYPAIATVNMGGNALSNVTTISSPAGTSNLALTSSSNITFAASNAIVGTADIVTWTATDTNPLNTPTMNLRSSNGFQGQINLTAGPGLAGIGGEINLRAEGGSIGPIGYGGLIELVATTPVGISNVTSAVKLSGACVTSYAGVTSAIGSTFGYNYLHGDVGTNITAGLGSFVPNFPGTVYIYGTAGTEIAGGAYIDHIYPYSDTLSFPNLKITGNTLTGADVELSNVVKLDGDNCAVTGINTITMAGTTRSIGPLKTLTMDSGAITSLSTINGVPYVPSSAWSTLPATSTVDMSFNNITNLGSINGSPYSPTSNWSTFPATSTVNMAAYNISNAENILFTGAQAGVGWEQSLGFGGVEWNVPASIVGLGSNGNLRAYGHIFSVDQEPLTTPSVAQDLMIINNGRSTLPNGRQRLAVICAADGTENGAIAYLEDINFSRGNMSSSADQAMPSASVPHAFTYTDYGTLVGITVVGSKIYSTAGGAYLLTFSIQFARLVGGTASVAEAWIRINGTDLANSNTRVILPGGGAGESVLTVPVNIDLAAGDYVEVVFGTLDYPDTVAKAYPARTTPYVAPAVPSIIVNMDQVA